MLRLQCCAVAVVLLGLAGVAVSSNPKSAAIEEDCAPPKENVIKYEQLSGNLSACIINNTAPARFCHLCIDQNEKFNNFFVNTLSKDCQDFSAFAALHLSYKGLWAASQCDACDVATMNQMSAMLGTLKRCIQTPQNFSDGGGDGGGDGGDGNGNETICASCTAEYKVLKDFYKSDMPQGCRKTKDIIDAYRRALSMWGAQHCGKTEPTQVSAQATLGTFFALIAAFYLVAYSFGADPSSDGSDGGGGGTDSHVQRSYSHNFSVTSGHDAPPSRSPIPLAAAAAVSTIVRQNEASPLVIKDQAVSRAAVGITPPRKRREGGDGTTGSAPQTKFSYESFSPEPALRAD